MIGKQILKYRITEALGEGGMGVVYKALDTELDRTVALKFLPPGAVENEEDRRRLIAEAKAAAALDHPGICTIYEIAEAEGQLFISMAHVEGETVKERVDRTGALSPLEAMRIAVQVAEGLAAAHEKGIVHQDIKSANVMVTPKGRAMIMDFGLAHRPGGDRTLGDSSTGGTIAYGSPEQARGERTDHRSDIWSFGVTLYEALTGRLPFRGDYHSAIVYSVLSETPPAPSGLCPDLPPDVDAVVSRCLAKDPADRYQSAEALAEALREIHHSLDPTISRARSSFAAAVGEAEPWHRRIARPSVVVLGVVYLLLVLAAYRVVGEIGERMLLSPHLKTAVLVGLLSLLPTVALLAARARGRELLVIPANAVLGALVVSFVFSGKDLGAATETVSVTDEKGQTVERVVPKGAYRKRIALYVFDNATGDEEDEWLRYAMPSLLDSGIFQDPFAELSDAFSSSRFRRLKSAGFQSWDGVPLSLKAKLAREQHMAHFVTGSIEAAGDEYMATVQLVESESGRIEAERTFRSHDLFALGDEVALHVKRGAGIPEWHMDEVKTLPVAEILTHSTEALKEYALAQKAQVFDSDWEQARTHLEAATALDSTMANAWYMLWAVYRHSNLSEEAADAMERCLRHSYRMPERLQFIARANYYYTKQEPDKALAVANMMTELYPGDQIGYMMLARISEFRGEYENAVTAYEALLEIDPHSYDLLHTIGRLHADKGHFDQALEYYRRYAEFKPKEPISFQRIGEVYESMGDLKQARQNYERALIADPQGVAVMLALARIDCYGGMFEEAFAQLQEALATCKSAEDRISVYRSMEAYYEFRGQFRRAIETQRKSHAELAALSSPIEYQIRVAQDAPRYVHIGAADETRRILDETAATMAPPFDKGLAFGYLGYHLARRDADGAEAALEGVDEYIRMFKLEMLRPIYLRCQGLVLGLRDQHAAAIEKAEGVLELEPANFDARVDLGEWFREMGDQETALGYLSVALKQRPFDPRANYQLALTYRALGRKGEADTHLKRALDVWSEADPEYFDAAEARSTAEEWARTPSM